MSYEFSVELQFEFEWLKRAINCSKWAISSQVGMRSLKGSSRRKGASAVQSGGHHILHQLSKILHDPNSL